jgi:phasin family protein
MAESPDKAADSAEKAYAAAAEAKPVAAEAAKSEPAMVAGPVEAPPASAAKTVATKVAPKKAAVKKKAAPARVAAKRVKKPAAKAKPVAGKKPAFVEATRKVAPVASKPKPTITQLKEKIMASAKTTDFTKPFTDAASEMQSKAKAALEKGTAYAGEMTEFAKGNVEALVESGKVLSAGAQDLGKAYAEDAKAVYETLTADMKEVAAIKSPTELFQLQGKVARRNFDAMVAYSSKTGDAMLKLYADAFAPITGRVSLAAEKISKAA